MGDREGEGHQKYGVALRSGVKYRLDGRIGASASIFYHLFRMSCSTLSCSTLQPPTFSSSKMTWTQICQLASVLVLSPAIVLLGCLNRHRPERLINDNMGLRCQ